MTYKFDASKGLEPIPGIPLEAADADFEASVERVEGKDALDAVKALYIHIRDAKAPAEKEG